MSRGAGRRKSYSALYFFPNAFTKCVPRSVNAYSTHTPGYSVVSSSSTGRAVLPVPAPTSRMRSWRDWLTARLHRWATTALITPLWTRASTASV